MSKIVIFQCSSMKKKIQGGELIKAKELYQGDLFKKSYSHFYRHFGKNIDKNDIEFYIISSKYGIIKDNHLITGYDIYISNLNKNELKLLNEKINNQIKEIDFKNKEIYVYAGSKYISKIDFFKNIDYKKIWPDKSLGFIKNYLTK